MLKIKPPTRIQALLLPVLGILCVLLGFQNCSKVNFETAKQASFQSPDADLGDLQESEIPDEREDPAPPKTCSGGQILVEEKCLCPANSHWTGRECLSCKNYELYDTSEKKCISKCTGPNQYLNTQTHLCVTCAANETWTGTTCAVITDECRSYQEILTNPGQTFVVPSRDTQQICYYVKIFDKVSLKTSDPSRATAQNVASAIHDSVKANSHPYILGGKEIKVYLQGERKVVINSKPDASNSTIVLIDNFFFAEFETAQELLFMAAGTSDSSFNDVNNDFAGGYGLHAYNSKTQMWELVPFKAFGTGGTSNIGDIELQDYVPVQTPTTLRLKALDCGGKEESSEGYLIFR